MTDIVGLTVSLLELSVKLYNNFQSVKDAPEYVRNLLAELEALQDTLKSVNSALGTQQSSVLRKLSTELDKCLKDLQRLDDKFRAKTEGKTAWIKGVFKQLKWPLKEAETREYISQIERLKTHLSIELNAHQLYDTFLPRAFKAEVTEELRRWFRGEGGAVAGLGLRSSRGLAQKRKHCSRGVQSVGVSSLFLSLGNTPGASLELHRNAYSEEPWYAFWVADAESSRRSLAKEEADRQRAERDKQEQERKKQEQERKEQQQEREKQRIEQEKQELRRRGQSIPTRVFETHR
jgi:hypothetical protein